MHMLCREPMRRIHLAVGGHGSFLSLSPFLIISKSILNYRSWKCQIWSHDASVFDHHKCLIELFLCYLQKTRLLCEMIWGGIGWMGCGYLFQVDGMVADECLLSSSTKALKSTASMTIIIYFIGDSVLNTEVLQVQLLPQPLLLLLTLAPQISAKVSHHVSHSPQILYISPIICVSFLTIWVHFWHSSMDSCLCAPGSKGTCLLLSQVPCGLPQSAPECCPAHSSK